MTENEKMMKKQLLLLMMMLSMAISAFAAEEVEISGLWYQVITKGKVAKVIKYKNYVQYSGDVIIPSTVEYNGVTCDVTTIVSEAFLSCGNLTSVTIPNSVMSIEKNAFKNCSALTTVTIGNGVTDIGIYAFKDCNALTSVHITDLAAWCKITFNTEDANPLFHAHHLFLNGDEIKDLVIPDGVTSIGSGAFQGCCALESVTIPNGVTSIGGTAFEDCTSLTSVTIPNSVTSIGSSAFSKCTSLSTITIPNSVTSISMFAFYGCSSLTSIEIPNGVTDIGPDTFWGCSSLTSVTIGNSVTRIQPSAFENCIRLTSIMIPNSVTNIGETAFANCTGLVTITIGNGVETIYSKAFANCPELTDVYCYATNIPIMKTIDKACTDAFEGSYIDYATLHVPAASVNAYSTTAPWSGFGTITGLDSPETPKCAKPTIQVVDGKLQFSCETEGVEFCYDIKNIDAASGTGPEIQMPTSTEYLITVYAKKDGYMNSEEASMSLVRSAGLKGDANNDGEVDIADAVHIVNFIVGKINNLAPRKDSNQRTAE